MIKLKNIQENPENERQKSSSSDKVKDEFNNYNKEEKEFLKLNKYYYNLEDKRIMKYSLNRANKSKKDYNKYSVS